MIVDNKNYSYAISRKSLRKSNGLILTTLTDRPVLVLSVNDEEHSILVGFPHGDKSEFPPELGDRIIRAGACQRMVITLDEVLGPAPKAVKLEAQEGVVADENPRLGRKERDEIWTRLHRMGFNVIPTDGKIPTESWKALQTTRQTLRDYSEMMVRNRDMREAGIVTGNNHPAFPGVVVVDADDQEALELVSARCPATFMRVKTRRGMHHYFRHPGPGVRIKSRNGLIIDGKSYKLDIKADGAIVIAPGSTNKDWVEPFTLEMYDQLQVFDQAWLPYTNHTESDHKVKADGAEDHDEFLREEWLPPVEKRIEHARRYLSAIPGTTEGEDASGKCYRLAICLVWRFALPADDAVELLHDWGQKESNVDTSGAPYPWTYAEIAHKISDAAKDTCRTEPGDKLSREGGITEEEFGRKYRALRLLNRQQEETQGGQRDADEQEFVPDEPKEAEEADLADPDLEREAPCGKHGKGKGEKPSQAVQVIRMAMEHARLFRSDNLGYASVRRGDHRENYAIESSSFARWIKALFYDQKGTVCSDSALKGAIPVLEAKALDGPEERVYRRFANTGDALYWDLANDDWEVVEVTRDGWEVTKDSPVKFIRTPNADSLPHPDRGGSLEEFRTFCATTDENWTLIKGWMLGVLQGEGPFFALIVNGEQGSVKSMLCRLLKRLLDPVRKAELGVIPKDEIGFGVEAENEYLVGFDNVSGISLVQSDCICRIATGAGVKTRKFYTNGEQAVFQACRPVLLNGIPDFAEKPDLLDRSIVILQPSMNDEDRKEERTILGDFERCRASVFGALLDLAVNGLKNRDSTRLASPPRMADAARWITACLGSMEFLDEYTQNKAASVELGLEASPVFPLLKKYLLQGPGLDMKNRTMNADWKPGYWKGTSDQLRDALVAFAAKGEGISRFFPETAKGVNNQLRRDAPSMRKVGIDVTFGNRTHEGRLIHVESTGAWGLKVVSS